jgi:hypothetical protein
MNSIDISYNVLVISKRLFVTQESAENIVCSLPYGITKFQTVSYLGITLLLFYNYIFSKAFLFCLCSWSC